METVKTVVQSCSLAEKETKFLVNVSNITINKAQCIVYMHMSSIQPKVYVCILRSSCAFDTLGSEP